MAGNRSMSVGRLTIEMVADTVGYVNSLKETDKETKERLGAMGKSYDRFNRKTDGASKRSEGLSGRLQNMAQSAALVSGPMGGVASRLSVLATVVSGGALVSGVVGLTLALTGLGVVASHGAKVFDETTVALAQMDAQIKLTGGTVGTTSARMDAFARKLALDTLTSTTEVRKAMSILATTTGLSGDAFFRTTKLAQDMAQVGFRNITSNSKLLAKALEDPIKGVTNLESVNVSFTAAQKKQVKELVEQNRMLEAQSLILDRVAEKYEGVASAIPPTIASTTDELAQRWDEFAEVFGEIVQPIVVEYLQDVNNMLVTMTKWFNKDFYINLGIEESVGKQIDETFGNINKVISDNSFGELGKSILEAENELAKYTKLSKELDNLLNNEGAKDFFDDSAVSKFAKIVGRTEEELRDVFKDNKGIKDYAIGFEELTKRQSKAYKAQIDQSMVLLQGSVTEQEAMRQRAIDKDVEAAAKAEEAKNKERKRLQDIQDRADAALAKKRMEDSAKARVETIKRLMPKIQKLGTGTSVGDMLRMSDEDITAFENSLELAEGMVLASSQDRLAKELEQKQNAINERKALEMEAEKNIGDAKLKLLQEQYAQELALYEQYVTDKDKVDRFKEEQRVAFANELLEMETANQEKKTEGFTKTLDMMNDAVKAAGKEGSDLQKALFLTSQAIAFANTVIAANEAAGNANKTDSTGVSGSLIFARTMANAAAIAATTVAGVAHSGIDHVPNEGTYLLQKGERVIQPKANVALEEFLKQPDTGSNISVSAPMTINGNVTDEKWFAAQLAKNRQLMSAQIKRAQREKPRR